MRTVETISDKIIRVTHSPNGFAGESLFDCEEELAFSLQDRIVACEKGCTFSKKDVYQYVIDGEPIVKKKQTANGEVSYIENAKQIWERSSWQAKLVFEIGDNEQILGMGQYEDGFLDYRNRTEYLYESNMRIAIPFFVTTGGYGLFLDSESNMIFSSEGNRIRFEIDTTEGFSYYLFLGDSIDEIIAAYQSVTGTASMLPKWAFGYIQSKEKYNSSEETLEIVRNFRERNIPIDCIVQDWCSWEEGLWGEKIFDKKRFPDLPAMIDDLHANHVHYMVSIWPNMNQGTTNLEEFKEQNLLLANANTYDAFDEEARALYFRQTRREILDSGADALWCDNAEPFSDADWNGAVRRPEEERYRLVVEDSKKSMVWERINGYGLYHAKGIYENWRKCYPKKRVVNLTRSGYAAIQQYGAILWSGDITAKWSTLRKQIAEGMKMGLTGMPYWTLDIGGFFVVKDKYENRGCNSTSTEPLWFWDGDYNDGVKDKGYCELYTRWLQFGTFLPVFRSHGTDTPREPWRFQEFFYEPIVKFIRLRYELMPYLYSMGYMAYRDAYIIMRHFAFDFPHDLKAISCSDEYMFGPALLVAPITENMYYGPDNTEINVEKKGRMVYLPQHAIWYDFWTNKPCEGGQELFCDAPIDRIPIWVRGGSILPVSDAMTYAGERNGAVKELRVYAGGDCEFELYNDTGDGYDYEKEGFCRIRIEYCEKSHTLTLHEKEGDYSVPVIDKIVLIDREGKEQYLVANYTGTQLILNFSAES